MDISKRKALDLLEWGADIITAALDTNKLDSALSIEANNWRHEHILAVTGEGQPSDEED